MGCSTSCCWKTSTAIRKATRSSSTPFCWKRSGTSPTSLCSSIRLCSMPPRKMPIPSSRCAPFAVRTRRFTTSPRRCSAMPRATGSLDSWPEPHSAWVPRDGRSSGKNFAPMPPLVNSLVTRSISTRKTPVARSVMFRHPSRWMTSRKFHATNPSTQKRMAAIFGGSNTEARSTPCMTRRRSSGNCGRWFMGFGITSRTRASFRRRKI